MTPEDRRAAWERVDIVSRIECEDMPTRMLAADLSKALRRIEELDELVRQLSDRCTSQSELLAKKASVQLPDSKDLGNSSDRCFFCGGTGHCECYSN